MIILIFLIYVFPIIVFIGSVLGIKNVLYDEIVFAFKSSREISRNKKLRKIEI
jgi:hypothetical protein